MEKYNRAVRRVQTARLKKKRRHYWGFPNRYPQLPNKLPVTPVEMDAAQLGKVVNTPQLCSCLGCGNQRHNTAGWTLTIQERRWLDQYKEQLAEIDESED